MCCLVWLLTLREVLRAFVLFLSLNVAVVAPAPSNTVIGEYVSSVNDSSSISVRASDLFGDGLIVVGFERAILRFSFL